MSAKVNELDAAEARAQVGPPPAGDGERPIEEVDPPRIAHAAFRGAVGAMAMSGMRTFTASLGLIGETPPRAIVRQRAKGLIRHVPRKRRRGAIELLHWTYGAAGGAAFGALPTAIRRQRWSGPVYGLLVWLSFELGLAPVLGLSQSKRPRPIERAAFAADHVLYGVVLSEMRARPQD